jgi:hypothetical protein
MSNFTDVYDLNEVFQKPVCNKANPDATIISKQLALIEEEFAELKQAALTGNWEELKDAVADVLVTTYGMGYACQFDCDLLMKNVSESNFSKVCATKELAHKTELFYNALGVKTVTTEIIRKVKFMKFFTRNKTAWIVKSAGEQTYTEDGVKKTIKEGKFLKCVDWTLPDLNVDF